MAVIPKSLTPSRIEANFDLDFQLTPEQVARIDRLNRNYRFVKADWWDFPDDADELDPVDLPVAQAAA